MTCEDLSRTRPPASLEPEPSLDQEAYFRNLFEKTPIMLHSIDKDGCLLSVSDRWLEVMGYRRGEVIGRRSTEFLTEESRRYALEVVLPDYMEKGWCSDIPYQMVCKNGRIIDVLLSATSDRDCDGNFLRSVAAISEITEQRKAERAKDESEARFRDVADAVSDWIWETDDELKMTYLSSRFADMTGLFRSSFLGQPADTLFARATALAGKGGFEGFCERRPFREQLFEIGLDEDKRQIVSVSAWPMFDEHGAFLGYRGIGSDMTEQIELARLSEALDRERERNEDQRQFVAMVSHEFKTPLAIIDGCATRLEQLSSKIDEAEHDKRTGKIKQAVKRLIRLIESTLTATRLETGSISFDPQPCDLVQLIEDVVGQQQEAVNHKIRLEFDPMPPNIEADRKLLDQVFTNLIANAAKYSPEQDTIWVRGRHFHDRVVIEIEDQGVGIPAKEIPYLFRRFYRATTSTGIVGTGLGLHIAKHFIELHQGQIDVSSVEGQGTIFKVSLPLTCTNDPSTTLERRLI